MDKKRAEALKAISPRSVDCPYCHAGAGQACTNRAGRKLPCGAVHPPRFTRAKTEALEAYSEHTELAAGNALRDQVAGSHYKDQAIQPVEYIEANGLPFLEGCIVKRATRHGDKAGAGVKDLEKIIHEARLIALLRYGVEI